MLNSKDIAVMSQEDCVVTKVQDLFDLRNPYIGNAPADMALLEALGIADRWGAFSLELETKEEPYALRLCFSQTPSDPLALRREMDVYATILLALIDNCSKVEWTFPTEEGSLQAEWLAVETVGMLPMPIKECGQSAANLEVLLTYLGVTEYLDEYSKAGFHGIRLE